MSEDDSRTVVGYSVFDQSQECYEYNENACYIADSLESARRVLRDGDCDPGDARIDPVTFDDIMNDFGCSGGQYAMELLSLQHFKRLADQVAVTFCSQPYDGCTDLFVVEIDGVRRRDD